MGLHGGRGVPKYGPETLKKAWQYLEQYEDVIHSVSGLAQLLGISRQTMHVWAKDPEKEDWAFLMDQLLCEQELVLLNKGLRGEINPTICKLLLARHGYHDKAAVEHSGPGGGPIQRITSDMSREEASRIYLERIRGG